MTWEIGLSIEELAELGTDRWQPALRSLLGHVLLGESLTQSGEVLTAITVLRDALEYLEGRYARQLGREKQARTDAAAPAPKRQSADKPAAKRGRKPKGNGPPPEPAPSSLPFGPGPALEA